MSTRNDTSQPLRDAPAVSGDAAAAANQDDAASEQDVPIAGNGSDAQASIAQQTVSLPATPPPLQSFDGVSKELDPSPGLGNVPDPTGAVGPNSYVQLVNVKVGVFSKTGVLATGFPKVISSLWSGFGPPCDTQNSGDPIVLYDQLADRWFLSQMSFPNGQATAPWYECIAVSVSGDPTGNYFRYAFQYSDTFHLDYPKFGVWPDAYYMSSNESSATGGPARAGVVAFDRARMLNGQPAGQVSFHQVASRWLEPSELEGLTAPPVGAPNYFVHVDEQSSSPQIGIFKFHVDFATPANSTFTGPTTVAVAPFDANLCPGSGTPGCIPQPGTATKLFPGPSRWPEFPAAYRNFGTHSSIVFSQRIDVDGTDHAGEQWYELRNPGGVPVLYQEGTQAPDSDHRFRGSAAMDQAGDIAVGYSVSGTGTYPSVRYAGRLTSDPLNLLRPEATMVSGGGSQTSSGSKWGDYSHMSVDPSDDCTFWYTAEYYATTSDTGWRTRIGSFRFPECGAAPPTETAGSAWYSNGTNAQSGLSGAAVSVYAVGLFPNVPYLLVSGTDGGDHTAPCRYNLVPVNTAVRFANSKGFVGATVGAMSQPPGTYQLCFAQADPVTSVRAVSGVLTFTVTG